MLNCLANSRSMFACRLTPLSQPVRFRTLRPADRSAVRQMQLTGYCQIWHFQAVSSIAAGTFFAKITAIFLLILGYNGQSRSAGGCGLFRKGGGLKPSTTRKTRGALLVPFLSNLMPFSANAWELLAT